MNRHGKSLSPNFQYILVKYKLYEELNQRVCVVKLYRTDAIFDELILCYDDIFDVFDVNKNYIKIHKETVLIEIYSIYTQGLGLIKLKCSIVGNGLQHCDER